MTAASNSSSSSSEDTREKLISAATPLFAQRGFDGVSVKELADSAGVNVSLVSYHFGGKENLYRACLEQFGKERLAVAQRILQPPKTVEELRFRLEMFLQEMFACHLERRETAELIHREFEADFPLAPDVFRETFLKVFETMIAFFTTAQANGVVRRELDPKLVSSLVFGAIKHIMHSDKLAKRFFGVTIEDETYRGTVINHILKCSMHGICPDGGSAVSGERSKK